MRIQQFISTISNNREYFSYLKRRMYIWSQNFFSGWVGFIGVRDIIFFSEMGVEGIRTGIFSAILLCESNKFEITSAWGSRPPPPFPSPLEDHRKQYKILTIIHELTLINQPLIFGGNC